MCSISVRYGLTFTLYVKPNNRTANLFCNIYNLVNEVLCWFHYNQHLGSLKHGLTLAILFDLAFHMYSESHGGDFSDARKMEKNLLTMLNILGQKAAHT